MSKHHSFAKLVAAAAAWVLLGGCDGPAPPAGEAASPPAGAVEAVDDLGRTVRLPRPAERIVSLIPATTETLVALGARDRLVARTDYDDPNLADLPSVGGGLTPSLELLASVRPDLVVAWEEAGANRVRPRLEAIGIAVFAATPRDTAAIYANIERLGALTGLTAAADSLAATVRAALEEVRRSVAGSRRPTVVYLAGLDPPIVAGPELFIGEVLSIAGGDNVFSDLTAASPQISMEEILRRRPEVVLIPGSGEGGFPVERLLGEPGWAELAASGTRIVPVPADVLHRPGPSVVAAARILRDAIHPELPGSADAR